MSLSDLDAEVREIKSRIEHAVRSRAKAEHEMDAAQAAADKVRLVLESEFGIETPEQAKRVLAELENELKEAIDSVRSSLDEMGV